MIEEIKTENSTSSNQKTYYEFLRYLDEEYEETKVLNESIDFDDYSK
jgi:hypothetical protein